MSKIKVQTKKQKFQSFLITTIIIFFVLLSVLWFALQFIEKENVEINISNMSTVEDVVKYYKCKYISEKDISIDEYSKQIELVFAYNLYTNETSNENFFNNIINDMARVLKYKSFILLDSEKSINIKVICENNKISKIIINDIEDYFIYMDSKIELSQYEEIPEINFQIESLEIQNLILNNWNENTLFGTRDSIFKGYYIFFDEGINTRTIDNKIYNVIFTNKYQKNVVNGIYPGMDLSTIEAKLGEPVFKDEELSIIGYKGKDIYIFFEKDQISIYRNQTDNSEEFLKLLDKFFEDEIDLLDFMNELTYIWPDYSEYSYDTTSFFISYPLKGIDVKVGYDETDGIIFYNNSNIEKEVKEKYAENTEIVLKLKIDNVFEAEKRRYKDEITMLEKIKNTNNIEDKKSSDYNLFPEKDNSGNIMKMRIISKNNNNPNREINDRIDYYLWLNNNILLFSQSQKGIYYYDTNTGMKSLLLEGKETFELKECENGLLSYDNETVFIEY